MPAHPSIKTAGAGSTGLSLVRRLFGGAAAKSTGAATTKAVTTGAPAAVAPGWRAGLAEFRAGVNSGRKFNQGAAEAAQVAPSLWRSVGHNMADQAVSGAIVGTALGAGMGAYQAQPGDRFAGAMAGAGTGFKSGLVTGGLAGGAGGAMRHARYKGILRSGASHDDAMKVMSKNPFENARDAWENRHNPGAWQADALEAAAVPATLAVENMAQGIGEMKNEKKANDPYLGALRRAKVASAPQLVVVPMLRGKEKSPEQLALEKAHRDAYENDTAIGRAIGPLTGTISAEALLRTVVDPHVRANPTGALSMLAPDSVPRKILLPGLGAALGAYGAHRVIQARREARERLEPGEQAPPALPAPPVESVYSAHPDTGTLGAALMHASNG